MKGNFIKLASYDIFDTTLIRKCGSAQNIFYILSKKLFPDDISLASDFFVWRSNAESKINPHKEHTIEDIYQALPAIFNRFYPKEDIILKEKDVESDNLIVNRSIKKDICNKRKEGYYICFITDMYLDSSFLKSVLIREGVAEKEDLVFVSCEHDASKRENGRLFNIVKNHYQGANKWIHRGDNMFSDVYNAKIQGISTQYVSTSYSKSEKEVLKSFKDYPFYTELSILIGLQRAVRLNEGNSANANNACDIVAPIYIPYVFSLQSQIEKYNIDTLYFLSRDAYILYELAKILLKKKSSSLRYLYLSRKSISPACKDDLFKDNIVLSNINNQELHTYKDDDSVILQYLHQEGVIGNSLTIGMVDVGWRGTTRYMLNKIKEKEQDGGKIVFFYYGFQNNVIDSDKGKYVPYIEYPVNEIRIKYWTEIIENYCSAAPHTSTIGYKRDDNKIIPILEPNDNEEMLHIAKVNNRICKGIASYIVENPFLELDKAFCVWGTCFLKLFDNNPKLFMLDTFKDVFYYDKKFVMEVPFYRLLRYFVTGNTGLPCIDELSIYYSWGIRVRRRYTLHTFYLLYKSLCSKFKNIL